MDTSLVILAYIICPLAVAFIGYLMKSHLEEVAELKEKIAHFMTESQVRQVLEDKLDPLKEDISEIKATLNHILTMLVDKA